MTVIKYGETNWTRKRTITLKLSSHDNWHLKKGIPGNEYSGNSPCHPTIIPYLAKQKTMNKSEKALALFKNFNCSQSVLTAFGAELGLSEGICLKLASGFGGGMACGETCGAVTGAYMVLGIKYGHTVSDPEAKAATKQKVRDFNQLFKEKHGSLLCKELLGVDISTPEGSEEANQREVFDRLCPKFIETACKILSEQI